MTEFIVVHGVSRCDGLPEVGIDTFDLELGIWS
jgi:hypothetical protein